MATSVKRSVLIVCLGLTIVAVLGITAFYVWPRSEPRRPPRIVAPAGDTLEPFGSAHALRQYVRSLQVDAASDNAVNAGAIGVLRALTGSWNGPTSPYGSQTAGIEEGDIVGVHGEHLIVLRRGRLFSLRLGDTSLTPIARVDVPPSGTTSGWYDEMLVSDDTIVVLGYSHAHEGTELSLFRIDGAGAITPRYRFYLRSSDYYSSDNYATRLFGTRLLMYVPIPLVRAGGDRPYVLPGLRTRAGGPWRDLIASERVLRPIQGTAYPFLHTVVECELDADRPRCSAQSIVGPSSREFYVSSTAVYVWVGGEEEEPPAVYRLPLDGSAPTALRTRGAPIDQFGFLEADDHLHVLVRAQTRGDLPEDSPSALALLSAPLTSFGADVRSADPSWYAALPRPGDDLHARYVGAHLIYGASGSDRAYVRPYAGGDTTAIELDHSPDRIEAVGDDVMIIGARRDGLGFTTIDLDGAPAIDAHGLVPGARESESRSHAFYYRDGLIGLPITIGARSSVTFFRLQTGRLTRLGELSASAREYDDHCVVSCTDWYGSGRPLFIEDRLFALLDYEIVEGSLIGDTITERRRAHLILDGPPIARR
jgi:hypothetical protein